jgi:hypothetical protein
VARSAPFPAPAASNRACGSLAHGSPTPFTAGIRLSPPVPEGPGVDDDSRQGDQPELVRGLAGDHRPAEPAAAAQALADEQRQPHERVIPDLEEASRGVTEPEEGGPAAHVSRPSRQPATGPPGSYPDRTHTGRRRRAYEQEDPPWHYVTVSPPVLLGARKPEARREDARRAEGSRRREPCAASGRSPSTRGGAGTAGGRPVWAGHRKGAGRIAAARVAAAEER